MGLLGFRCAQAVKAFPTQRQYVTREAAGIGPLQINRLQTQSLRSSPDIRPRQSFSAACRSARMRERRCSSFVQGDQFAAEGFGQDRLVQPAQQHNDGRAATGLLRADAVSDEGKLVGGDRGGDREVLPLACPKGGLVRMRFARPSPVPLSDSVSPRSTSSRQS